MTPWVIVILTIFGGAWIAAIIGTAICASRIVTGKLYGRYPALLGFFIASVVKSCVLFTHRHDPSGYFSISTTVAPVMSVLYLACLLEATHRLTEHQPRFGTIRAVLMAVCVGIGVLGVYASAEHWTQGKWTDGIFGFTELANATLAVALALFAAPLTLVAHLLNSVPVTRTAKVNAFVLPLYLGGQALSVALARDGDPWMVASWIAAGSGIAAATAWIVCLTPDCDRVRPVRNISDLEAQRAARRLKNVLRTGKITNRDQQRVAV